MFRASVTKILRLLCCNWRIDNVSDNETGKEIKITGVRIHEWSIEEVKAKKRVLEYMLFSPGSRPVNEYWQTMCRFFFIAADLDDVPVAKSAYSGSLEQIAKSAIVGGNVETIMRKFFENFPDSEYIVNSVLKHQNDVVAFESVLRTTIKSVFARYIYDDDSAAVKSVADVAQNYSGSGQQLKRIMNYLEAVANNAPEALSNVAQIIPLQHDEKTSIILGTIGAVVRWTKDSEAVNAVVDALRNYKGAGFKPIMELLAHKAYITHDGSLVKAAAERYVAESKQNDK